MNVRHAAAPGQYLATETHARAGRQPTRPPEVLVIWESGHGSTAEISNVMAEVLRGRGLRVALADAAVGCPEREFDAYIIGSAVSHGHTMKHVKQFARAARRTLLTHPVWLFSTVQVDHRPTPDDAPLDLADLFWCTAPKQHQVFAGKLDPSQLTIAQRALATIRRVPYGDFRDWAAIRRWADDIATAVLATNRPGRVLTTVQGGQS